MNKTMGILCVSFGIFSSVVASDDSHPDEDAVLLLAEAMQRNLSRIEEYRSLDRSENVFFRAQKLIEEFEAVDFCAAQVCLNWLIAEPLHGIRIRPEAILKVAEIGIDHASLRQQCIEALTRYSGEEYEGGEFKVDDVIDRLSAEDAID